MSYLDALQRTQQSQDGTSSGYVETDIRKPLDPNIRALKKAKYKTLFESLTPKERMDIRKKLEARKKMRLEKAKPINDDFKRRATQNQKRTESIISDKEAQMKAIKDAENKAIAKKEKAEEKAEAKADRKRESQEKMYLDFGSVKLYQSKIQGEIQNKINERALALAKIEAEFPLRNKEGEMIGIQPSAEAQYDATASQYTNQINQLKQQEKEELRVKVDKLAFETLQKYGDRLTDEQIFQLFDREGLGEYYKDFLRREKAKNQ